MEVNHSLLYMWIAVAWMYSLISSGLSDSQILRMAFVAYVERRGDGYGFAHGDFLHGAQLLENIQDVIGVLGTTHQGEKIA